MANASAVLKPKSHDEEINIGLETKYRAQAAKSLSEIFLLYTLIRKKTWPSEKENGCIFLIKMVAVLPVQK